jgi:glyoxylase-like metal-dependent hydrolase (beta-lactamase superfamily II)
MYQFGHITDSIAFIDNGLLGIPGVGATYVLRGDEIAIVETGTSTCAPLILEGLEALGIAPRMVRHILLTHVHMDHAGGAGVLVDSMPDARVYIHEQTAPHLVDPSRLIPSAERALAEMFARHGTIVPLAPERLVAAQLLRLPLGRGLTVHAIPTPGHSADHLAYWIPEQAALFTGDGVGIMLPRYDFSGPVTPPPGFDPVAQRATFRTLLELPVEHLLFSHWGRQSGDAHAAMIHLQARFEQFFERVERETTDGALDPAALVRSELPATPLSPDGEWLIGGWTRMNLRGIARYLAKQATSRP